LIAIRLPAAVVFSTTTLAGRPDLAAFFVPHDAHSGMCARYGRPTVYIKIQDTLAIVPWMPMMAGTLATR
jgi:hypothetical protein